MPANTNVPAPQRKRFSLTGRTIALDPRLNAVRGDLADVDLADRVFAPHYAKACTFVVVADTQLREAPHEDATVITELSKGEHFFLLDISGSWGWGHDGKTVGYVNISTIEVL